MFFSVGAFEVTENVKMLQKLRKSMFYIVQDFIYYLKYLGIENLQDYSARFLVYNYAMQ